jgi:HEPN domain-containing protein
MSRESARARALLWWRQAAADLRASSVLAEAGEWSHSCFQAQQAAEKSLKALLADRDEDLRSHSLAALLRELGGEVPQQWAAQARALDKLYAPTRYPDALGDVAPMDVFGPEDAERAMQAAKAFLDWAASVLNPVA